MAEVSRRTLLKASSFAAAGLYVTQMGTKLPFLQASPGIENPLLEYPNRDWERIYRDQYAYDDSFTFICAPNDTHQCRLRAFVRNGVVVRI